MVLCICSVASQLLVDLDCDRPLLCGFPLPELISSFSIPTVVLFFYQLVLVLAVLELRSICSALRQIGVTICTFEYQMMPFHPSK